jgi:hypothetical protein
MPFFSRCVSVLVATHVVLHRVSIRTLYEPLALCWLRSSRRSDAASFRSASLRAQPRTQSSGRGVVATVQRLWLLSRMIGGEAIKNSLSVHPPVPVTRVPRSVSGACWPYGCSPRSAAFPPHSPPSTARFCSNDSSVLCRCPTPQRRTCGSYGLSLHPPSCCFYPEGASEVSRFFA